MKDTTTEKRRCCGMDVHKEMVVVCVLPPDGQEGKPVKKVYGTFRNELSRMRGWLKQLKVTEIAMESTGVYWRPIWNVLEGHGFHLVLANPQQVKALHGRKSDKRDSQRIAEFQQDRRIDPSFVPPPEIRRLRDLLRYRVSYWSNATRRTTRFAICSRRRISSCRRWRAICWVLPGRRSLKL